MYCRQCGQAIGGQSYCPNCGAPTGISSTAATPLLTGAKVARHLRTLGILWVVFSIYLLLHWLLILPFLRGWMGASPMWMHGSSPWIYGPFHPGGWFLHVITIAVVVRVILSLAVGIALLTRQPWGRIFAIVIAVLTLLKPIVGTILAIYTLWILLSHNAGQEYDRLALTQEPRPL